MEEFIPSTIGLVKDGEGSRFLGEKGHYTPLSGSLLFTLQYWQLAYQCGLQ
jgi:hypothetical protein